MKVREMVLEDAPAVAALSGELGYPCSAEEVEKRWRSLSTAPWDKVLVVTSPKNEVLGFAQLAKELSIANEPRCVLRTVVVSEAYRGKGVGAELVKAAESLASEMGVAKMRVASQVKRTDAHRFYERLGYRIVKSWHVFEKELKDGALPRTPGFS